MTASTAKITYQSSKAEEIALLHKFAEQAGHNTYLSDFLTPDMVAWLEWQIKQDVSTDIFHAKAAADAAMQKAEAKANEAQALVAKANEEKKAVLDQLRENAAQTRDIQDRDNKEIVDLRQRLNAASEQTTKLEEKLSKLATLAQDAWLSDTDVTPELLKTILNRK